jgi:hypothetical protein
MREWGEKVGREGWARKGEREKWMEECEKKAFKMF